jgi:hypothetical protein
MRIALVFEEAHPPVAVGITRYVADLAAASIASGDRGDRGDRGLMLSFHAQLGKQKFPAPVYGPANDVVVLAFDIHADLGHGLYDEAVAS